ncbi:ABC-F family ATP-binding cassette domain-containing protein [Rubritalea marina]|uniref:ABC-F family ATP-binding cassette domain-containing protein n=1 Tax=Rubritalea marina TaxID=361055 RepID=UPI0012EAC8DB|nr:ABC-F family ATP-binding cassette domain-containing protein [Rubritalea marina]
MSEPAIASASELTVRYSHHTVLDGASLAIQPGDRIGLVGRNGSGKSTFIKICAGVEVPDSGEYVTRNDLVTGYLPQEFELDDEATVLEATLSGSAHVIDLIQQYEQGDPSSEQGAELLEAINHLDGWTIESRAQALLNNLHAPEADRLIGTLSGGEKRRVAMARALLAAPDFLILDEPTNHLDTGSIEWLETFLSRYAGTCLFVTHDRYFLDNIATRIVEMSRGKCVSYEGNYTDYLVTRAERMAQEAVNEHKRQRFLKKELEWVRRRPSARRTKSRDRMDKYFEVADQEAPEQEVDVDLIIPPAGKLPNIVIEGKGLTCEIGDRTLFRNFDFKLEPKERIGVVGRNGMGKSTLLKVLLGMQEPSQGSVQVGARVSINYVDQNRLTLNGENSIFDEVGEGQEYVKLGDENLGLRAYLKRFLFDDDRINTKINLLSGGERSRVLLAKILKKGGNVLVLDEPTNDLDLNTLRLLEEALAQFKGSVLVVSHDRYFLNRVCTRVLAFEDDGMLYHNVGSYDYYLEKKAERDKQRANYTKMSEQVVPATVESKQEKSSEKPQKLKWSEERELETIEEDILRAEEAAASQQAIINAPNFYAEHTHDYREYEVKLEVLEARVLELYERWEELNAIKAAWDAYHA